jgi:hypothetical protein
MNICARESAPGEERHGKPVFDGDESPLFQGSPFVGRVVKRLKKPSQVWLCHIRPETAATLRTPRYEFWQL